MKCLFLMIIFLNRLAALPFCIIVPMEVNIHYLEVTPILLHTLRVGQRNAPKDTWIWDYVEQFQLAFSVQVNSVSPSLDGQWLASGSEDGSLKLWEVSTGRCLKTIQFEKPVKCCTWCPDNSVSIISVASGKSVFLLYSGGTSFPQFLCLSRP